MQGKAYIGTSGWVYKHWKTSWYENRPAKDWLTFCAERFTALEANGTHYRLPKKEALVKWRDSTPPDFRFAIKAHRYLTHHKKLLNIAEGIQRQKEPAEGLGEKLGCVVWQLPASFRANIERLKSFCEEIKAWPETRHAIEFRHDSWYTDEVAVIMHEHRLAVCMSDAAGWPIWDRITTDLVYLRFHGHTHTYWSAYSEDELRPWAKRIEDWLRNGCDVHAYFDNDANGAAPHDAETLLLMVMGGRKPQAA